MYRTDSLSKTTKAIAVVGALSLIAAIAIAGYSFFNPGFAGAGEESMTDMMSPAQQEAASEIAAEEVSKASNDASETSSASSATDNAESSDNDSQPSSASTTSEESSASTSGPSDAANQPSATSNSKGGAASGKEAIGTDEGAAASSAKDGKAESDADNPTATVYYFEYVNPDDPESLPDRPGIRLLGKHEVSDLEEGQQLHAWDYVVDIPGLFFWDGWPRYLTITKDASQNVIELYYMRLYNAEFTVNYYMMTGANLAADNWTDALNTGHVKFTKLGSETFKDQPIDEIIKGEAYEYKLDDMYVIDTYPAQIRLGTDPDNNVLNVLYTPATTTLPDEIEIPDELEAQPPESDSAAGSSGPLPGDETLDKDEAITLLPDDSSSGNGQVSSSTQSVGSGSIKDDFLGSPADRGELNVTDDLLTSPVTQDQADMTLDAYKTGQHAGSLAQTGDTLMPVIWVLIGIAIASGVTLIVIFARRAKSKAQPK